MFGRNNISIVWVYKGRNLDLILISEHVVSPLFCPNLLIFSKPKRFVESALPRS